MTAKQALVITIASEDMRTYGYKHGPCIQCRQLGEGNSSLWEVEFAYEGETGRSKTTDPPSIVLQVNTATNEVRTVDLM